MVARSTLCLLVVVCTNASTVINFNNFGCSSQSAPEKCPECKCEDKVSPSFAQAVAVVRPTEGNAVTGTVQFLQSQADSNGPARVVVHYDLAGFAPHSVHGFHVHELGDVSAVDGTAAGGHYNPHGKDHSLPVNLQPCVACGELNQHVGDLGNVVADAAGAAQGSFTFYGAGDIVSLTGGNSVIGRGIILHAGADQGHAAQPSGGAGSRMAQGVIGIMKTESTNAAKADVATDDSLVVVLRGTSNLPDASGKLTIHRDSSQDVKVSGTISGLGSPDRTVAIHIHEFGDATAEDGTGAGGHYNPAGVDHALPSEQATQRHMGDMGNVNVVGGQITVDLTMNILALKGTDNIRGRSVVVHEGADQGQAAQPSGGAGARILQGVIGVAAST